MERTYHHNACTKQASTKLLQLIATSKHLINACMHQGHPTEPKMSAQNTLNSYRAREYHALPLQVQEIPVLQGVLTFINVIASYRRSRT